ncbi:Ig-like domain-containing protein [Colwellia sp. E150_009]
MIKLLSIFRFSCMLLLACTSYVHASIGWLMPVSDFITKGQLPSIPMSNCLNVPTFAEYQEEFQISWCGVDGATSYQLVNQHAEAVYVGAATSFITSNIEGEYTYKVRACNSSGCSDDTSYQTISIAPLKTPVGQPNINLNSTNYEAVAYQLNWSAAEGYIEHYQLEITENGQSVIEIVGAQDIAQFFSTPGERTYRVQACNESGCGQFSEAVTTSIQAAATDVIYLDNPENGNGLPQSTNLNFYLNWQVPELKDGYLLQYSYQTFDGQRHEVELALGAEAESFHVSLPEDAQNGQVTFYLMPIVDGEPLYSAKVIGQLRRQLATPVITDFSYSSANDTYFTVEWQAVPLADTYKVEIFYLSSVDDSLISTSFANTADLKRNFSISSLGIFPKAGTIYAQVKASSNNNQLEGSISSEPYVLSWRTSDTGGSAPEITINSPRDLNTYSLIEPIIISAEITDDSAVKKVIIKVQGDNVAPRIKDEFNPVTDNLYQFDLANMLNNSHTGRIYIDVTAIDDYGKQTIKSISFRRNADAIPRPVVTEIRLLEGNNFQVSWNGENNGATSNHLMQKTDGIGEWYPRIYRHLSAPSFTYPLMTADERLNRFYIKSCYGENCEIRKESDEFQLKNWSSTGSIITIKTELLGTVKN